MRKSETAAKRSNKKRALSVLSAFLAIVMVVGGTFGYFTDFADTSKSGTAGTVDIELDDSGINLLDADGQDILNPGDRREVSFKVTNLGNKSVDVRTTITIASAEAMATEGQAEYELYWQSDVEFIDGKGWKPKEGASPVSKREINNAGTVITYLPFEYILNGSTNFDERETEPDVIVSNPDNVIVSDGGDSATFNYVLIFKCEAGNAFQGDGVNLDVKVEAKQHRNTGAGWELVGDSDTGVGETVYTLRVNYNGGSSESGLETIATFNDENPIYFPTDVERSGFDFTGWEIDNGEVKDDEPIEELPFIATASASEYLMSTVGVNHDLNIIADFNDIAYALILKNPSDSLNPYPMIFVASDNDLTPGSIYNSATYGELEIAYSYMHFADTPNVNYLPWYDKSELVTSVVFETEIAPSSLRRWFYNFQNCVSMDLTKLNTSNTTDMACLFAYCYKLSNLKFSNFDTANVTNMYGMFGKCSSLSSLNLSHFNTDNVEDMSYLFHECSNLKSVNISTFNTSNVINMQAMFNECSSMELLNVNNFDTSNVADMAWMFCGCDTLSSINVNNFDVSKVTNMYGMFAQCDRITSIDISNWTASQEIDAYGLFYEDSALTTVKIGNCNIPLSGNSFYGCKKLSNITFPNGTDYFALLGAVDNPIAIYNKDQTTLLYWVANNTASGSAVVLPASTTTIAAWAFSDSQVIKTLGIRKSLLNIETGAFNNTSITKIIYEGSSANWNGITKASSWGGTSISRTYNYNFG